MERCNAPNYHQPGKCACVINPDCLREVRRRRMLSFEAVVATSGYTREHLAGVERGDQDKCVDAGVIMAYEQAMGSSMEAEVHDLLHDLMRTTFICLQMFTRLYQSGEEVHGGHGGA